MTLKMFRKIAPGPIQQLAALYASIPSIDCQGYCHRSCGPIVATQLERRQLLKASRQFGTAVEQPLTYAKSTLSCDYLTEDKRCRVHASRPLLCRLYGVAEGMPCTYGCIPERVLPDADVQVILKAMQAYAGAIVLPQERNDEVETK